MATSFVLDIARKNRRPLVDDDWADITQLWDLRDDTVYLNHGSFGPSTTLVRDYRRSIIERLDRQPMDFYVRQYEPLLEAARTGLAEFVGTDPGNLVFVENATFGMNVVANSFPLSPGDQILLNDHEYGAVHRIWQRAAEQAGAEAVSAELPEPIESADQVIDCLRSQVTDSTRLLIISHITSPTALILPVKEIAAAFRRQGIAVCIDGPHAPAQVDLDIADIGCDFYTASCHKWLSAPFGSGFCFAHPRWHEHMQPVLKSWGRLLPALPATWDEEFIWSGTRDPSPYLSIPTAIEILQTIGLSTFRERCYALAGYARDRLVELTNQRPWAAADWYGTMAHVPLPPGDHGELQQWLWQTKGIEVPIIDFKQRWFVRVSCHLYNRLEHIDLLVNSLEEYLDR